MMHVVLQPGRLIRATHPYAFRSGEWAQVVGYTFIKVDGVSRSCYDVMFEDGVVDTWAIDDPAAGYEVHV